MQPDFQSPVFHNPGPIGFSRRRDPFRSRMWLLSLSAAILSAGWLLLQGLSGTPEIYQARGLSNAHKMFENQCNTCHEPFIGPMERLLSPVHHSHATSAPDKKCVACHEGPGHYFSGGSDLPRKEKVQAENLVTQHDRQCADCHQEHAEDSDLRRIASGTCRDCHSDLKQIANSRLKPESLTFQKSGSRKITDFADHPEFTLTELLTVGTSELPPPRSHGVSEILSWLQRPGDAQPRWQDRARIRFNHKAHLQPADARGLPDTSGQFQNLKDNCAYCHEPDTEKRYMRPVSYERHCQSCHPLVFDPALVQDSNGNIRLTGHNLPPTGLRPAVVPHRPAAEVRAFLVNTYLGALVTNAEQEHRAESDDSLLSPRPGRNFDQSLPDQTARLLSTDISERLIQADARVRSADSASTPHTAVSNLLQSRSWLTGSGGCGYCHEIRAVSPEINGPTSSDIQLQAPSWEIEPTQIPERWFPHSSFNHDSHRNMNCLECHSRADTSPKSVIGQASVLESTSTGDVLMPSITVCRQCHLSESQRTSGRRSARADCIECHDYHQRPFEKNTAHSLSKMPGTAPELFSNPAVSPADL